MRIPVIRGGISPDPDLQKKRETVRQVSLFWIYLDVRLLKYKTSQCISNAFYRAPISDLNFKKYCSFNPMWIPNPIYSPHFRSSLEIFYSVDDEARMG